jgi:hypothetical protein
VFKWGRLHFFFDWSASSSRVSSSIREKNHLDLVDAFSDDGTRAPCHTHLNPYQRIENVPFLFTAFHLAIVMALFSPFFSPTNYRYCLAYNRIIGHHGLDHEYKRAVTSWKKLDWRNYTRVDGFEMIRFSHLAILLAICPSLSSFFSFLMPVGKALDMIWWFMYTFPSFSHELLFFLAFVTHQRLHGGPKTVFVSSFIDIFYMMIIYIE